MTTLATADRDIYTVSRLNREARALLERGFATLWVEAELSNVARPASGHWYFTLKDATAQVRAAMFRQRNLHVAFAPKDGLQVLARGRISLYEPRGDYQLIVDHLEEAGEGALRRQFEELKNRLFKGDCSPRNASARSRRCPGASASSLRRPGPRSATSCMS